MHGLRYLCCEWSLLSCTNRENVFSAESALKRKHGDWRYSQEPWRYASFCSLRVKLHLVMLHRVSRMPPGSSYTTLERTPSPCTALRVGRKPASQDSDINDHRIRDYKRCARSNLNRTLGTADHRHHGSPVLHVHRSGATRRNGALSKHDAMKQLWRHITLR